MASYQFSEYYYQVAIYNQFSVICHMIWRYNRHGLYGIADVAIDAGYYKWNAHCWLVNAVTQISVAVSKTRWQSYPVETDFSYENLDYSMLHILKASFFVSVWWIWCRGSLWRYKPFHLRNHISAMLPNEVFWTGLKIDRVGHFSTLNI